MKEVIKFSWKDRSGESKNMTFRNPYNTQNGQSNFSVQVMLFEQKMATDEKVVDLKSETYYE